MSTKLSYEFFSEDELGTNLFGIIDSHTGYSTYTTLSNKSKQYPSVIAFAGARFSRSALSVNELLLEIKDAKKGAQARLADIFKNYGHASVGDMALLFAYVQNVPLITAFSFFYNTSIGAGQERSSRYQDYRKSSLIDLSLFVEKKHFKDEKLLEMYKDLESYALDCYEKYLNILTEEYTKYYKPGDDKVKLAALKSRVFDSARYFLLSGFRTSFAYITSAREWARIISELKPRKSLLYKELGEQLEELFVPSVYTAKSLGFTPEAPDLIRHTKPNNQVRDNLAQLRQYLEANPDILEDVKRVNNSGAYIDQSVNAIDNDFTASVIMVAEYVLSIYPDLNFIDLLSTIDDLEDDQKIEISKIIFDGHDNYTLLDNIGRTSSYGFFINMTIGEARDLNRHRSFGRFSPILEYPQSFKKFLNNGFGVPLYLRDVKDFKKIKDEFILDLKKYYDMLNSFIGYLETNDIKYDGNLILTLLPLASNISYIMHGSAREISYLTSQRIRPGGHINYREIAYLMANEISKSDPLLSSIKIDKKPDASNVEEFFDRS